VKNSDGVFESKIKRVIIYLLPRNKFFKVAFVFGQKASEKILESNISDNTKAELFAAKVHAEGRGIRIEVRDRSNLKDIEKLIKIKIDHGHLNKKAVMGFPSITAFLLSLFNSNNKSKLVTELYFSSHSFIPP
jgi:hypothetical protein